MRENSQILIASKKACIHEDAGSYVQTIPRDWIKRSDLQGFFEADLEIALVLENGQRQIIIRKMARSEESVWKNQLLLDAEEAYIRKAGPVSFIQTIPRRWMRRPDLKAFFGRDLEIALVLENDQPQIVIRNVESFSWFIKRGDLEISPLFSRQGMNRTVKLETKIA